MQFSRLTSLSERGQIDLSKRPLTTACHPTHQTAKCDRYGEVHRPNSAKRRGALCVVRSLVKIVGCKNTLTAQNRKTGVCDCNCHTPRLVFETIDLHLWLGCSEDGTTPYTTLLLQRGGEGGRLDRPTVPFVLLGFIVRLWNHTLPDIALSMSHHYLTPFPGQLSRAL